MSSRVVIGIAADMSSGGTKTTTIADVSKADILGQTFVSDPASQ
jgi:hypothetical protein